LWRHLTARWGNSFLVILWSFILLFAGYAFFKLYRTSRRVGVRVHMPVDPAGDVQT
jgi:hypothetical protein